MRRFRDTDGAWWEVVAGRESWGALFAIFVPVDAESGIMQAPLEASSYQEAAAAFDAMDDGALQALLERAKPKAM